MATRTLSSGAKQTTTTLYLTGLEIRSRSGQKDERVHYIRAGSTKAIYTSFADGTKTTDKTHYLHKDHLDSVTTVTDQGGKVVERLSYDPWGQRRKDDWTLAAPKDPGLNTTPRGFTGHEHLDSVGLIHMNGRVYDPRLARFVSADPFVQDPTSTQNFNRYTYVMNNPLSLIDPSGFYYSDHGFPDAPGSDPVDRVDSDGYQTNGDDSYSHEKEARDRYERFQYFSSRQQLGPIEPYVDDIHAAGDLMPQKAALKGTLYAGRQAAKKGPSLWDRVKSFFSCCFVAGTLVETETGLRPIEEIEVGDKVWARNTETGETVLKPVTDLIRRHERIIWEVKLSGDNGVTERFETTDDHPWWTLDEDSQGRWVITEELTAGMTVVSRDPAGQDKRMVIDSVAETERTESTYNLTVADFETYFVGEQRILVHNCARKFEPNPKHGPTPKNTPRGPASSAPTNPQSALDKSIELPGKKNTRLAVDEEAREFVVFNEHGPGKFHGHVRSWDGLTQRMQSTLRRAGLVTKKGKIIDQ